MSRPVDIIKPNVRELRAYTLAPHRARVKMNQNENPRDAPLRIKQETQKRLWSRQWSRYPDFVPAALHEALSRFAGWTPSGVLVGNGSNELIQALLMVTVGRGKRVLISEPTFTLYRQIATVLDGEVMSVPLNENLGYDVAALRQALTEARPDVTIICSPNNPTGCVLDTSVLSDLLRAAPGLLVIDEAYHEFNEQSVVPLLSDHPNLIVLRTFSKAMAMAGLRIGYLLAAPDLTGEIRKAMLPYNLNVISQTAAEVAIDLYEPEIRPLVRAMIVERDRLYDELGRIDGLAPVKSKANFLVVRSRLNPRRVFAELLQRDILIRDVSNYPMLAEYFRVSVGTPEENDKLIIALREIFREE